eukprot:371043_1
MALMLRTLVLLLSFVYIMSSNPVRNLITSSPFLLCESSRHCIIHCSIQQQCVGKTLLCPTNKRCTIHCDGTHSCSNTTVIGNQSSHLHFYTSSAYAASNAHIHCPSSCQIFGNSISHHQWHNIN